MTGICYCWTEIEIQVTSYAADHICQVSLLLSWCHALNFLMVMRTFCSASDISSIVIAWLVTYIEFSNDHADVLFLSGRVHALYDLHPSRILRRSTAPLPVSAVSLVSQRGPCWKLFICGSGTGSQTGSQDSAGCILTVVFYHLSQSAFLATERDIFAPPQTPGTTSDNRD